MTRFNTEKTLSRMLDYRAQNGDKGWAQLVREAKDRRTGNKAANASSAA